MTGIGSSSCGACKFLRRRCTRDCVFAPHFSYEQASTHFAAIHKVFGASNVSKLLMNLPVESRSEAAITISYEAFARMHDPVYGCVSHIFALQNQVASLKEEIEMMETQMAAATHEPSMGKNKTLYNMEHLATWNDHDIILQNLINQGSSFLYQTGNNVELMSQLPQLNRRDHESNISQLVGDPDPFMTQISEMGQSVYMQNPWNTEVAFN